MFAKEPAGRRNRFLVCAGLVAALWLTPAVAYEQEVQRITTELTAKLDANGVSSVAVVDFTDLAGNVTQLGRFLAEEVSIALSEKGQGFQVMDRTHLAQILKEHRLGASGLMDPETVREVRRLAGVQALVTATLTPFGDTVRLSVKVVDTETAAMVASSAAEVAKIGTIADLLRHSVAPAGVQAGEAVGSAPAQGGTKSQSQRKFVFEVRRCEMSGQTVTCRLAVRNDGKDRTLNVLFASRMYDDQGNEYRPSRLELANSVQAASDRGWGGQTGVGRTLIYDVPVQATLTYEGISPQATRVASLKVKCQVDGEEAAFEVAFRDLSLEAKTPGRISSELASPTAGAPGAGYPGGSVPAAAMPRPEPRSIEDALEQEVEDVGRQVIRRWSRGLLDALSPGSRKKKKDEENDEDGEDGDSGD